MNMPLWLQAIAAAFGIGIAACYGYAIATAIRNHCRGKTLSQVLASLRQDRAEWHYSDEGLTKVLIDGTAHKGPTMRRWKLGVWQYREMTGEEWKEWMEWRSSTVWG